MRIPSLPVLLRRGIVWAVAVVGAVLLCIGWATSSPVGASPDEVHHVVYSWGVVTGQTLPGRDNETSRDDGAALTSVVVPGDMLEALDRSCYAFKPAEPACAIDPGRGAGTERVTSTTMTRYPPLYYLATGLVMRGAMAAGTGGEEAILLARVASGIISFLSVGVAAAAVGRRFGTAPALVVLSLAATPQFIFLSASVNPNGFEIAFGFAQAACVVAAISDARSEGQIRAPLAAGLCVTTLCLGLARPASIVWALAAALLLLIPFGPRPALLAMARRWRIAFGASIAVGVAWFVYLNSMREGGVTDHDVAQWKAYPFPLRSLLVVLKFGDIIDSGYGLLGWADTKMPRLFLFAWLVVGVVALTRLSHDGRSAVPGQRWAFVYLALCAGATAAQSFLAGFGWQGRYFMPCVAAFTVLLVPGMAVRGGAASGTRNTTLMVIVTMFTLGTGALALNLGRYLYGYSELYKLFEKLPVPRPVQGWEPLIGRFEPLQFGVVGGTLLLLLGCVLNAAPARGEVMASEGTGAPADGVPGSPDGRTGAGGAAEGPPPGPRA